MKKKRSLKEMEEILTPILEKYPQTRDSDKLLYLSLLYTQGYNINCSLRQYLKSDEYPNYDSVSRVRRKIQEKRSDLRPKVGKYRCEKEQEYIDYALYDKV